VAVAVALQTATSSVAGIEEGALRALATVRQVMPARLRQRVDALRVTAVPRGTEQPKVDTEHLIAIGSAVRAHEILRFDYDAPNWTGAQRPWQPPRRVEPHHLVTWGGRWYLISWDLDRVDWRTFRVDRMTPKSPTGPRFSPRELPGGDVASYIDSSFRGGEWPCRGEFILHAAVAEIAPWVRGQAVVEELGPNRCRVLAGSWSWDRLAAWVGMFDVDLEVVGPVELRDAAARLSRRYAAAAGA
jgi:predicted DNA-binding transcriptional regulator YafY